MKLKRSEKIFTGLFGGIIIGAVIGALGGFFDRGSIMILVPSGNPFWAIVGAIVGSIGGFIYGMISKTSPQNSHYLKPGGTPETEDFSDEK